MKIEELLKSPTEWVKAEGPNSKIVLSSRVRLARNLQQCPVSRLGEESGTPEDPRNDSARR